MTEKVCAPKTGTDERMKKTKNFVYLLVPLYKFFILYVDAVMF